MGWMGSIAGFFCGRQFGGVLGGIAGAVLGSCLQEFLEQQAKSNRGAASRARGASGTSDGRGVEEKEVIFLTAVGAMLAKLSKADGHVDETEIAAGERAFVRLGLDNEKRAFCIRAFRTAKLDGHTIYDYADAFASVVRSHAVRELFYDILWDLACADGVVSDEEREILARIPIHLGVRTSAYAEQYRRRLGDRGRSRRSASATPSTSPYDILGIRADAADADVRKAYREKAKKLHPDLLRAQGLPEDLLAKANEQMARVNAAWDEIRRARGMK